PSPPPPPPAPAADELTLDVRAGRRRAGQEGRPGGRGDARRRWPLTRGPSPTSGTRGGSTWLWLSPPLLPAGLLRQPQPAGIVHDELDRKSRSHYQQSQRYEQAVDWFNLACVAEDRGQQAEVDLLHILFSCAVADSRAAVGIGEVKPLSVLMK